MCPVDDFGKVHVTVHSYGMWYYRSYQLLFYLLSVYDVLDLCTFKSVYWLQNCAFNFAGDESVNFLVIGDWGGLPVTPYTTAVEQAIARQMGKFATSHDVQFILALGDNFYYDGVSNVNDPRFQVRAKSAPLFFEYDSSM